MASKLVREKVDVPISKARSLAPGTQWTVRAQSSSNGGFTYAVENPFRNTSDFNAHIIDLNKDSSGKVIPVRVKMTSGYAGAKTAVLVPNGTVKHAMSNVMFVEPSNDVMILWGVIVILVIMYVK